MHGSYEEVNGVVRCLMCVLSMSTVHGGALPMNVTMPSYRYHPYRLILLMRVHIFGHTKKLSAPYHAPRRIRWRGSEGSPECHRSFQKNRESAPSGRRVSKMAMGINIDKYQPQTCRLWFEPTSSLLFIQTWEYKCVIS